MVFTGRKIHYFTSESSATQTGTIVLTNGAKLIFKGNLNGLNNVDEMIYTSNDTVVSISNNAITATGAGTDKVTITDSNGKKATVSIVVNEYLMDNILKGDVNCDETISVIDVVMLQKWLLASKKVQLSCWQAADINSDGIINIYDMILLKRELLKK